MLLTTSIIAYYYLNCILAGPFDRKGEEVLGYIIDNNPTHTVTLVTSLGGTSLSPHLLPAGDSTDHRDSSVLIGAVIRLIFGLCGPHILSLLPLSASARNSGGSHRL